MGVAHDVGPALARELAELDEGDAAVAGEGGVAETGGIEQEAAGGIVAVLVGEHAVEHQDLRALRMAVRMEGRIGVVAHDRGDTAELAVHEVEALGPHPGVGAGITRSDSGTNAGRTAQHGKHGRTTWRERGRRYV